MWHTLAQHVNKKRIKELENLFMDMLSPLTQAITKRAMNLITQEMELMEVGDNTLEFMVEHL